jgi:hypothetical protein
MSCQVIRDKRTWDPLQYAFIEYDNGGVLQDAVDLYVRGLWTMGSLLTSDIARRL